MQEQTNKFAIENLANVNRMRDSLKVIVRECRRIFSRMIRMNDFGYSF